MACGLCCYNWGSASLPPHSTARHPGGIWVERSLKDHHCSPLALGTSPPPADFTGLACLLHLYSFVPFRPPFPTASLWSLFL